MEKEEANSTFLSRHSALTGLFHIHLDLQDRLKNYNQTIESEKQGKVRHKATF